MTNGDDQGDQRTEMLPVQDLVLDADNPRLPEDLQDDDQDELIEFVAANYEAVQIAESLAQHGYFPSEPLVAIDGGDVYVVVEGNRRLAALKLLHDEELRQRVALAREDRWDELAGEADLGSLDTVPVDVRDGRNEVDPVLGFRHISGIEPWDPWAKARFIARMVERREEGFDELASAIGERETDVRSHYRNYRITLQAEEDFRLNTDRVKQSFGIFTRAMQSPDLRGHVGAPPPREIEVDDDPIPEEREDQLDELLAWMFGSPGEPGSRVISESREINDLAQVMASEDGIAVLRETGNLQDAFEAAGGILDRLTTRLTEARNSLQRAREDIQAYRDEEEVQALLEDCHELLDELQQPE